MRQAVGPGWARTPPGELSRDSRVSLGSDCRIQSFPGFRVPLDGSPIGSAGLPSVDPLDVVGKVGRSADFMNRVISGQLELAW